MFGVQSVRETQNIDLVITLEDWSREKEYDRLGLEEEYTEFLGNRVVCHNIPIRQTCAGESGKEKKIKQKRNRGCGTNVTEYRILM